MCRLLKNNEAGAWEFFLEKLIDQEAKSPSSSRKCADWGVAFSDLIGRFYEDMMYNRRLWKWEGRGSLYGWARLYLRGYLNELNPNGNGRLVDIDACAENDELSPTYSLGERISAELSEKNRRDPYVGEDLRVLRNERWKIAENCFKELWQENSVQAYVLLLKTRFHMSSLEIKERFGISSAANVDQLFSRAVKKMKEAKVKYET